MIVIPWVIFAAPSLYTAAELKLYAEIAGICVNTSQIGGAGLALMPVYSLKTGMLWKMEQQVQERLVGASCHTDRSFALCFDKKSDLRDKRTLVMSGWIITAASATDDSLSLMCSTPLFQRPLVMGAGLPIQF